MKGQSESRGTDLHAPVARNNRSCSPTPKHHRHPHGSDYAFGFHWRFEQTSDDAPACTALFRTFRKLAYESAVLDDDQSLGVNRRFSEVPVNASIVNGRSGLLP